MVRHFFTDKGTTIIKGSKANLGLNPILSLNYGATISRILLHFNEVDILNWIKEDGINDFSKLSFKLHMTNCFSVDNVPYDKKLVSSPGMISERAASFKLDAFKLQQNFDAGRGYEYSSDLYIENKKSYSEQGANWYSPTSGTKWKLTGGYGESNLISSTDDLKFDFGNENINLDITNYVINVLNGEKNYGIGLKFQDELETMELDRQYTVNFFSDNTNTFFHPFIEAVYNEEICDSREHFINGKENKLYLYAISNGERINLDKIPKCSIDGKEYPVTKAYTGIYYATVKDTFESNNDDVFIKYDLWSGIFVNGVELDDIEMEFNVKPKKMIASIGSNLALEQNHTVPCAYGIDDNESLLIGEVRQVTIDFRKMYTTSKKEIAHNSEYRIYIKSARREITIFDYSPIEHAYLNNYFVINTNDLIPGEYFVDIMTKSGLEKRFFKEVLRFNVKSDLTEKYY